MPRVPGGTLAAGGGRVVVIDRAAHGTRAAPTPLMLSCFITQPMPTCQVEYYVFFILALLMNTLSCQARSSSAVFLEIVRVREL